MIPLPIIAVAVLSLLLTGSGFLLKSSWERNAELTVERDDARKETRKANDVIVNLREQNTLNNYKLTVLEADRAVERTRYEMQIREIRGKLDSSTRAALEEPERFGRIATYTNRRLMREVCRSSGGTEETCRIAIPDAVDATPPISQAAPPSAQ